jgi:hypothetical protein
LGALIGYMADYSHKGSKLIYRAQKNQ